MLCETHRQKKKKKMSMENRVLVLLVLVISLVGFLAVESAGNGGGSVRDYITWDDLTVDENGLVASKSNSEDLQVIVVDQNGKGDSSTVQGAVDMVPDHNSQRVKIYISPGTYRSDMNEPF